MRSKGQISLNFDYHVSSIIFIPNFVCVLTNKRHSAAGVMPQGLDLGVHGGSKPLAWGFAMAPKEVSPLQAGDHKAAVNRCESMTNTRHK